MMILERDKERGGPVIALIDYGMGNLRSVEKAFTACGVNPTITSDPKVVSRADKIILPGVGAFSHAMRELRARKLLSPIREKILSGTPYLGICLGLQLLFSESEEGGRLKGMGIIPGPVVKFRGDLKVPHMGWNNISIRQKKNPLLKGILANTYFYFVHSYYGVPEDREWVLTSTHYGKSFCSSVSRGHVFATQFHPEKSQREGLKIIKNFIDYRADSR